MATLIRTFFGGLVLLLVGMMPNSRAYAQQFISDTTSDDSLSYHTTEWGPEVNGVSIRVTFSDELYFGDSLTVFLEKRVNWAHAKSGVINWSNSVNGSSIKLTMVNPRTKARVHSSRGVPNRPSMTSDERVSQPSGLSSAVIGRFAFELGRYDNVPYVPEPSDTSTKSLGYPTSRWFPAEPGTYHCCVTISVPSNSEGAWSGEVRSDTFQVRVGPEFSLKLPVVLVVPREYQLGPECSARYDMAGFDTVRILVRPNYYVGISQYDLCCYSIGCGTRCTIYTAPDTVKLDRLFSGKIALRRFDFKPHGDFCFTGVVSAYSTRLCAGGSYGGTTLWEKQYKIALTPNQVDSLINCGCSEPPKGTK